MNPTSKTRQAPSRRSGFIAGLYLSVLAAIAMVLMAGMPAMASTGALPDGNAKTELVITKFEQPGSFGAPATGAKLGEDVIGGLKPISGVTFEARRVPGVDLTTNAGQQQAAQVTVSEAAALVAGTDPADSGTTGADGVVHLGGSNGRLGVGLYLVTETETPADVVPSAPFLVALPLTNPSGTGWMYQVYVYPKNARVGVSLDIFDQDAVSCGDAVTWTAHASIPLQQTIDTYTIHNVMDDLVFLTSLDDVDVRLSSGGLLLLGVDYTLSETLVPALGGVGTQRALEVEFTAAGRAKLAAARAADPTAEVVVSYDTTVQGTGELVNEVRLLAGQSGEVEDSAVTKWGPLRIQVHERGDVTNLIAGADFKLYLTAEDALERRNPITINGQTQFQTDEDGMIVIGCLRFSDFANGLDREPGDPLYRPYVAAPDSYPEGWEGETAPLQGAVEETEVSDSQILIFVVWEKSAPGPLPPDPDPKPDPDPDPKPKPDPDGNLPKTGAQIGGVALLASVLVIGGTALMRKRRAGANDTVE